MENNNQTSQSRFLIAAVLSIVVLFGWSYFFAPAPSDNAANTAANANAVNAAHVETANVNTANGNANTGTEAQPLPSSPAEAAESTEQPPAEAILENPARTITISSPLYEVTLDTKGALATSWILFKSSSSQGEFPVFADGSDEANKKPLQLISEKANAAEPREIPFRLSTADAAVNEAINSRNYQVSIPDETVTLAAGEEKAIDFTLVGPNGVEVTKSFVFRGDSFVADLSVDLKQNGQPVPNTKLLIGASISDHAINHHTFYQIESEAMAGIDGDIYRHQGGYSFDFEKGDRATLSDAGSVDWAGVGDAYFAMVAIPATPSQGVEYNAAKYEVETDPYFPSIFSWVLRSATTSETRHLVTAAIPINADGSVTKIYTGTKDYFLLNELSEPLSQEIGRTVNLVDLINFSNYWPIRWFVKPISIPIVYALHYLNRVTQNYGVAIIIFTFFFYSLLFPLRWSQSKSFKKAAGNAPKMKEIQERIKAMQKKGVPNDDPRMREIQMEQLRMTKDALPIGGCLPMLLQFPLLISFYTAVTVALEVRQASFMWIPDLSAGDPWHLLEFAFAISMVLAMKFTPTGVATTPEQQMQQKMMTYLMPVMMLWIMWSAPAGLLLYWFFGNIVSFGQQMIINRLNKRAEPGTSEVVDSVPAAAKKVKQKKK